MAAKIKVNAKEQKLNTTIVANDHMTIAALSAALPGVSPLVIRQQAHVLGVVISPSAKKITGPRK
jgi:hypothetical protein